MNARDLSRVRTIADAICAPAPGEPRVVVSAGPLEVRLPDHGTTARAETCSCTRCKRAARWFAPRAEVAS